ncbi:MAG: DUF1704 domain-containing protein [Planctomycetota bacterium]|nr:DUF1704 domain-containing protein [Planctomycetota bacterium]
MSEEPTRIYDQASSLTSETSSSIQHMESSDSLKCEHEDIPATLIDEVCARLANNKAVKRALPGGGRLNIDRLLPFLCVYRRNPARQDSGTELFVHAEAAFLNAPGIAPQRKGLTTLVHRIAQTAAEQLGGFLVLELWSGPDSDVTPSIDARTGELELSAAAFRLLTRVPHRPEGTFANLEYALQRIRIHRRSAAAEIVLHADNHPPDMSPLIPLDEARAINCHVLGLEIAPIYRDPATGEIFPDVLRQLRRGVGRALKKAFFTFALNQTNTRPQHYFALGRKSLPKLVWDVDRQLTEVSSQFKFLLQLTPINAERAWQQFRDSGFRTPPRFEYRPLNVDPLLLKRQLLQIRTEDVEDPTLSHLMRQTQDELDRQITMLADLGTARFLPGSLQVFGGVAPELLSLATEILLLPYRPAETRGEQLNAGQFAALANEEFEHYRAQLASFTAEAVVREDTYSGLLCTGGNLLIGRETSIPASRANALLQHEVGTHLVTYYNGAQQPLGSLRVGLAGYDGLQEGLAVLSEYLVGGLNLPRLRLLAARVVAVHDLIAGVALPDTYRRLTEEFALEPRQAFTVALRVYRGGGLTKDAVYLRGLRDVLRYVQGGGDLLPLFVGKMAIEHIPIIQELQYRKVLKPTPIVPRYLQDDGAITRLAQLRGTNISVVDLVGDSTSRNESKE